MVEHVEETLTAIQAHLAISQSRFSKAATDLERDSVLGTLRLLNGLLGQMQQANTWVDEAGRPRLGTGTLRMVDEVAEIIVGQDADVITAPSDVYRFATTSAPFLRILRQLGVSTPTSGFPIVVFFPSQEAPSLLLEPLLMHELGHSAVARNSLVDAVVAHRVGKRGFERPFSAASSSLMKRTSSSRAAARIGIERHLRRWLTEFLCDAIATVCCGPSYAYAFASIVSAESSIELQESHPPTALRVRLILDHLDAMGWTPLMMSSAPRVYSWMQYLGASTPTMVEPHHMFLLDVTTQFVVPLRTETVAAVGPAAFAPPDFAAQSDELKEFLRRRVLPAQLHSGAAGDRRSIVLAGWFHALSGGKSEGSESDEPKSLPRALSNTEFGLFLDKAVEMSAVLEAWSAS